MLKNGFLLWLLLAASSSVTAGEFHVSKNGKDTNPGSISLPFLTISAAANAAMPGDTIIVHQGTYRERVTPPRGGTSDTRRIVYEAAAGEKVLIKGSEIIRDWKPFQPGVWKATLPHTFFGKYNPYRDLINGDWFSDKGRPHHTGEVYLNGKSLYESHLLEGVLHPQPIPEIADQEGSTYTWFCESDEKNTYIYANFHERDPNRELVEIHVRDSCFYPDQPGRDYITVRGFHMSQAATQWAAPTAEQIGLIGTHWSKGWIIENNVISDSKCSGITLGKDRKTGHNVWNADRSKDGAIHYNEVIVRALDAGWSRDKIGSHLVRNNTIFNCEQTGICGSLGAIFSQITDNHIYNIWTKRQFGGAELAGIKIHAAIDLLIRHNRLHDCARGLWMDWMAQGTRISGNLAYRNYHEDLFMEVNHGPYVIDNNIFLSENSLNDMSQGGAYAYNLITGKIISRQELTRKTPYHRPHSTELAGLDNIRGGDDRFYNNLFFAGTKIPEGQAAQVSRTAQRVVGYGLYVYDAREYSLQAGGNVYGNGAQPYGKEANPFLLKDDDVKVEILEEGEQVYLRLNGSSIPRQAATKPVTTELLGTARIANLLFENFDGNVLHVEIDYFSRKRNKNRPSPGPFEEPGTAPLNLRVW